MVGDSRHQVNDQSDSEKSEAKYINFFALFEKKKIIYEKSFFSLFDALVSLLLGTVFLINFLQSNQQTKVSNLN